MKKWILLLAILGACRAGTEPVAVQPSLAQRHGDAVDSAVVWVEGDSVRTRTFTSARDSIAACIALPDYKGAKTLRYHTWFTYEDGRALQFDSHIEWDPAVDPNIATYAVRYGQYLLSGYQTWRCE